MDSCDGCFYQCFCEYLSGQLELLRSPLIAVQLHICNHGVARIQLRQQSTVTADKTAAPQCCSLTRHIIISTGLQLKDKDEGASKEYFIGFLLILN